MKQYLLSVYHPDLGPAAPPPENIGEIMRDIGALNKELRAAGVWVFAGGLQPSRTATVVRLQGGEVLTSDGAFVEGEDHIGGFWVIEAPDRDAALEWARKATGACRAPIEVRPFQDEAGE